MEKENYKVRFIPIGGVIGVTKNMYVYELYKDDQLQDILVIDCGIGFPDEKDLGVDFVIPDITYLLDKVDKIRAILLTHGHEDHISALPYHYQKLGSPPMFTAKLTSLFIEGKFKEFNQKVDITVVEDGKEYTFGGFKAQFINMTHSIPDTKHILIKTPIGNIYHGPDFKLDLTPPYGNPPDFYQIAKAGHDEVLCLLSDCLGSEREGLTLSEAVVGQTFEDEMRKTKGKFIMTTFSSNISRIRQCVEAAIKFNRKIIFMGRSMKDNTTIANEIGYLPIPFTLIGKEDEIMNLPPNKVCLIVAGSQGQHNSALSKIAMGQNRFAKIKNGDKVIFSSDPIPGNENEVFAVVEDLVMKGADVVYSDIQDQLHASGHGNQEDIKLLIRMTNPKFFIPIGGTIRHQRQYQKLAAELGYNKDTVFMLAEGESVWFQKNDAHKGEFIETRNIFVDAFGVGDVGTMVLKDRKTLSSEGIVFVVLLYDKKKQPIGKPIITSRGFVFEKGEDRLFGQALKVAEKVMKGKPKDSTALDLMTIRKNVSGSLEEFFYKERGRYPLVVVETIEI